MARIFGSTKGMTEVPDNCDTSIELAETSSIDALSKALEVFMAARHKYTAQTAKVAETEAITEAYKRSLSDQLSELNKIKHEMHEAQHALCVAVDAMRVQVAR